MLIKVISVLVEGEDSVAHPSRLREYLPTKLHTHIVGAIYTMEMRNVRGSNPEMPVSRLDKDPH